MPLPHLLCPLWYPLVSFLYLWVYFCFITYICFIFQIPHKVITYSIRLSLSDLFLSIILSNMSVLQMAEFHFFWILLHWIHTHTHTHTHTPSLTDRHLVEVRLGCFHILGNVNSASMNIGVHISFQISVFRFLKKCSQKWNC